MKLLVSAQTRQLMLLPLIVLTPNLLASTMERSPQTSRQAALVLSQATEETAPPFTLCDQPECDQADYYVGYHRTNRVQLEEAAVATAVVAPNFFPNLSNAAVQNLWPQVNEQVIDHRDGNFVTSIHRIEQLRIGFSEKSELLHVHTLIEEASAEATVRLMWGETLTITSDTLSEGTPVQLTIERQIGGFGNPITAYAYYDASATTYINGTVVPELSFAIARDPGPEESDRITGDLEVTYTLDVAVGETFTLESLQTVVDGVKGNATEHQMLNGADSVSHRIRLSDEFLQTTCLISASGTFQSGNCDP